MNKNEDLNLSPYIKSLKVKRSFIKIDQNTFLRIKKLKYSFSFF